MVFAARPVIAELNEPLPAPSIVLVVSATVGLAAMSQTTPLAVTAADPSELILPPELTPVVDKEEAMVVVNVGNTAGGVIAALSFLHDIKTVVADSSTIIIFFMTQK